MNDPVEQKTNPYEAPSAFQFTEPTSPPTTAPGQKAPIPGWAWIFVVACAAIPILAMGGAIPAAIGCGGAAACVGAARNPNQDVGVRVGICVGITGLCWALFVGLIVLVVSLQAGR